MTKMKRYLVVAAALLAVAGCQRRPLEWGDPAGENCRVRFRAGSLAEVLPAPETSKASGQLVPLPEGATVRVVAYQRQGDGQGSPDPSLDTWKASSTYKVESGDLVPCLVSDDGAAIPGDAEGMELHNGTYDFYAYSAARKLEADNRTVKGVGHGEDFMGAFVGSQTINRSSSTVSLEFEHECAKITFAIVPADGMQCEDLTATSVKLKKLAAAPAADYTIGGDLVPSVGGEESVGEITTFAYKDDGQKGQGASGSGIFLPKTAGTVPAEFTVRVNSTSYRLTAELPEIAFKKGNNYRFTAKVKQTSVELVLTVLPWDTSEWGDGTEIGGFPDQTITVGEWSGVSWDDDAVGADPSQGLVVGTWTFAPSWGSDTQVGGN